MTIAENLQRIQTAKADIKTAIENKGVNVGDITIDGYAAKIDEITVGGGGESGLVKLPNGISLAGSTFTGFDMNGWDWSNVYNLDSMFDNCANLTQIIFPNNLKPLSMLYAFRNCGKLEEIDLSGVDLSNIFSLGGIFAACISLKKVILGNVKRVKNLGRMFESCTSLTSVDLSGVDLSEVTNMGRMFYQCQSITSIKFGSNVDNVTAMDEMFYNCNKLESIDLSGIDISKVTTFKNLFASCIKLSEIKMKGQIKSDAILTSMFLGLPNTGVLYYDERYDYSSILSLLPLGWTSIPTTFE